jgi:hypothetical protein
MPHRDPTRERARKRDRRKPNPRWSPNLLGHFEQTSISGPSLPVIRPAYNSAVARALHDLAESNPTPREYQSRKEAILAGNL